MNFALILFLLTVATGVVWLGDKLVFERRRREAAARAVADFDRRNGGALVEGPLQKQRAEVEASTLREPSWIEYPKSFFPVLLIVFLLRSFLAEPFRIPSSSMRPTLVVGDYILVNKFVYGLRLPIVEQKIVPVSDPRHGDVVVFRYPVNPSQDFIKRVVAIGGDRIEYRDKQLSINGKPLPQRPAGTYSYLEGLRFETTEKRIEQTADVSREYTIGVHREQPSVMPGGVRSFPGRENCDYNDRGFVCTVPAGHYFMMGDNRDASDDSRYWGFVPDDHIRGRAFFIWFNWDDIASLSFQRVGSGIR